MGIILYGIEFYLLPSKRGRPIKYLLQHKRDSSSGVMLKSISVPWGWLKIRDLKLLIETTDGFAIVHLGEIFPAENQSNSCLTAFLISVAFIRFTAFCTV